MTSAQAAEVLRQYDTDSNQALDLVEFRKLVFEVRPSLELTIDHGRRLLGGRPPL